MKIAIAGAHGQIGLRLGRLLSARGDSVVGLVRNPDHVADLAEAGVEGVVLDLEEPVMDELAEAIEECDAVVFAAGAGPGSGAARKDTVDRGAAVLLAVSAGLSGISRYLLVSSIGVDSVRGGATPSGVDEVFLAYLRAKLAAEEALLKEKLDLTILRPGGLTNDAGTGRVTLAPGVDRGQVTRDDVAAVLVALLDEPRTAGLTLGLIGGDTPITEAVGAVCG